MLASEKSYVILLNYNNFIDTIECLESVFKIASENFIVIVCDNGSRNESLDRMREWAEMNVQLSPEGSLTNKGEDSVSFHFLNRVDIDEIKEFRPNHRLILIDNCENLGFAAGNNVGIRLALKDPDLSYVWILNNDTIVDPGALRYLREKMLTDPEIGLVGSTLLYLHDPLRIQALGGFSYFPILGISRQLGHLWRFQDIDVQKNASDIERKMFGVQGASAFVSRRFLEQVGLLSEEYFLYFEEEDWAMRAKGIFRLGYAPRSIVYHKEGRATGSVSYRGRTKSLFAEYYLASSRLRFTRKYFPIYLLTVCFGNLMIAVKRLLQGDWNNALIILFSTGYFFGKNDLIHNRPNSYSEFIDQISHSFLLRPFSRLFLMRHEAEQKKDESKSSIGRLRKTG